MLDVDLKPLIGRIRIARTADAGFHLSDDDFDALLNAAEKFANMQDEVAGHLLHIGSLEKNNAALENTLREIAECIEGALPQVSLGGRIRRIG